MAYIFVRGIPTGFQVYDTAKEVEAATGWTEQQEHVTVATFRTVEGHVLRVLTEDIRVVVDD